MFDDATLHGLYRYGLSLTNEPARAYDLLHDALERYLGREQSGKAVETPQYYVRRIMRNRFIDELRRQRRFPLQSLEQLDDSTAAAGFQSLDDLLITQQRTESIWAQLNPLERELLHLWAVEEFTAEEIARQTDTPRGTILSRIHRLRKKLAPLADDSQTETGTSETP